jgi:hypothetical protein
MSTQAARGELHAAFDAKLRPGGVVDATLASLGVVGVFDIRGVPENQAFDYITLGKIQERPNNTFGRRGYDDTVWVHIWSRALGTKNVEGMMARLNVLFDWQPLSMATQTHIFTMFDWSDVFEDPDGLTLHGVVRYKTFSQE